MSRSDCLFLFVLLAVPCAWFGTLYAALRALARTRELLAYADRELRVTPLWMAERGVDQYGNPINV